MPDKQPDEVPLPEQMQEKQKSNVRGKPAAGSTAKRPPSTPPEPPPPGELQSGLTGLFNILSSTMGDGEEFTEAEFAGIARDAVALSKRFPAVSYVLTGFVPLTLVGRLTLKFKRITDARARKAAEAAGQQPPGNQAPPSNPGNITPEVPGGPGRPWIQ